MQAFLLQPCEAVCLPVGSFLFVCCRLDYCTETSRQLFVSVRALLVSLLVITIDIIDIEIDTIELACLVFCSV